MKPILFNTEMVRAIQNGTKTATRRVVKPQPAGRLSLKMCLDDVWRLEWWNVNEFHSIKVPVCPDSILYVRETFFEYKGHFYYKADGKHEALANLGITFKWHPSIHMPREAARIFLRVTDVWVERLQDSFCRHGSTIFQLQKEGIHVGGQCRNCINAYGSPCCSDDDSECGVLDEVRGEFADLWDSTINSANHDLYGWTANPWVWVISFERISREEAGL